MKKILVTGGAGFIGSHVVVELVSSGYQPVIVDNFSNSDKKVLEGLKKITKQDIRCYEQDYQKNITEVLAKEKIDGVIHFAAYKSVGESVEQPLKYYGNNVTGLLELLKAMQNSGIPNLVFSSSCTVYGEPDKLPITEESPTKPATSPYGASKQMCEIILKDVTSVSPNLRTVSLRYFNPIGAHESALIGELPIGVPANLVPFITQTAAGIRDKLTVFGNDYPTPDGTNIRDYIHVVDLAKAHIKALEHVEKQPKKYYEVFNVGTGKGSSVLEIIKAFEEATGQKVKYEIGPRRAGDIISTYASVDKAEKVLDWKAEKTLKQALEDAWRWQIKVTKGLNNG